MTDALKQIWEKVDKRNGAQRMETEAEHIARDMREGRFPDRSDPIQVQVDATDATPRQDLKLPPPVGYISREEHAALILEAEERGMERAANIAEADAKQLTEEALQWRADNMPFAAQFAEEQAKAGPRIAAAIRAAKATP